MIRIFIILVVLFLAAVLGSLLGKEPGYILISTETWRAETTLWIGIMLLILVFFVFHACLVGLRYLLNLPILIKKWYAKHQMLKARAKTSQGLIEYNEGDWRAAKTHLLDALPYAEIPLFNYLTAARSAQELDEPQLRDTYLREAQQIEPRAQIAVMLTQAQLQIASHQWEQALATLQHLHELAPKHPGVLKLLAHVYENVKDWTALIKLLPTLKKYGPYTGNQFEELTHLVYFQAFNELCKAEHPPQVIEAFYKNIPKTLQRHPDFILLYGRFLQQIQNWEEANQLLKQALGHHLNKDLIELYAELPLEEDKLHFVKKLLKQYPHDANLLALLGQLNFKSRLFGQAQLHFEESLSIEPNPKVYYYLGETLEALDLPNEAYLMFKQGLRYTT